MTAAAQQNGNMQIANTILQQLGGGRFITMTGARDILAIDAGLQFKMPARFAKDGINFVKIELADSDTYTMTFGKVFTSKGMPEYEEICVEPLVYADALQATFTSCTGLDTHL
jgi:hypothetical protein